METPPDRPRKRLSNFFRAFRRASPTSAAKFSHSTIHEPKAAKHARRNSSLLSLAAFFRSEESKPTQESTEQHDKERARTWAQRRISNIPLSDTGTQRQSDTSRRYAVALKGVQPVHQSHEHQRSKEQLLQATFDVLNGRTTSPLTYTQDRKTQEGALDVTWQQHAGPSSAHRRNNSVPLGDKRQRTSSQTTQTCAVASTEDANQGHGERPSREQIRKATLDALNGHSIRTNVPTQPWQAQEGALDLIWQQRARSHSVSLAKTGHRQFATDTSDARGRSLTRKPHVDDLRDSARRHREESDYSQRRQSNSRGRDQKQRVRRSSLSKPLPSPPSNLIGTRTGFDVEGISSAKALQRPNDGFASTLEDVLWRQRIASPPPASTRHRARGGAVDRSSDLVQALKDNNVIDLNDTEQTHTAVVWSPAVTHETNIVKPLEIIQPAVSREVHNHHLLHQVLPVIDMEILPARHFVPDIEGGYLEISEDEIPGGKPKNLYQLIADTVFEYKPGSQLPRTSAFSLDGTADCDGCRPPEPDTYDSEWGCKSNIADANTSKFHSCDENGLLSEIPIAREPPASQPDAQRQQTQSDVRRSRKLLTPDTIPIHTILPIKCQRQANEHANMPGLPTAHEENSAEKLLNLQYS